MKASIGKKSVPMKKQRPELPPPAQQCSVVEMLTSAWERRSPHSCFWRRCVPAWPGPCPQSSQISLWLISTLQKSSVAFLQRNEATDCGNQSLIVCVCACARANMAACVCQCERAACELCVVPSLPPLRQQIAVVPYWNKGAAPFSFPSFFLFFHARLSFSWAPARR